MDVRIHTIEFRGFDVHEIPPCHAWRWHGVKSSGVISAMGMPVEIVIVNGIEISIANGQKGEWYRAPEGSRLIKHDLTLQAPEGNLYPATYEPIMKIEMLLDE